ncbi:Dyp-type peroxidase [Cryptosporangium aurantiacum]|uniref:Dye decolorizing peroxidase n=1 Tax=Cryptosporangium aurantiacum TaxID=134849 RepID=A0A1M7R9Z7_9ACTN|nr:Dyp-type peroxidase [Cryptosporangium aurantiacum]SHN43053.1 dye decolorizing peroxidase [Cryptosporangium aurantiacum]
MNRRGLLTGGAAAVGGALVGAATAVAASSDEPAPVVRMKDVDYGHAIEPFHGRRQSGVDTRPQAFASFVGFTLKPGTDRAALGRMLRLLTDDAARLTQGRPALGDTEAELALLPARLTVTFGFGPGLYEAAGLAARRPASAVDLPAFAIDRLQARWSGGDLLLQICADDATTVAHAQRMLIKDARPFAAVRWVQRGFRRGRGVESDGATHRNLMGQLDGTVNPVVGSPSYDPAVWVRDGPVWLKDSTTLVLRRIRMEIETWDKLSRTDKELAVGRKLDTGAPLTGEREHDEPDFTAVDSVGLPVMPNFAHVTRAHVSDERLRILRRPYSYDGEPDAAGVPDSGLIFAAFQADIAQQYVPIQKRLAEQDLMNQWTTPIGSAVFAIPPGCAEGGWVGEQVLS